MRNAKRFMALLLCLAMAAGLIPQALAAQTQGAALDAEQIVSSMEAVYDAPPSLAEADRIPDGPLLGNGDIAVVSGGSAERQVLHISKGDLSMGLNYVGSMTLDLDPDQNPNLALGAKATADSEFFSASRAVDGDLSMDGEGWVSNYGARDARHWIMLDLLTPQTIKEIKIYHDTAARPAQDAEKNNTYAFCVQYWAGDTAPAGDEAADDAGWRTIASFTDNTAPVNDVILEEAVRGVRYLRLDISESAKLEVDNNDGWGVVNRARIQEIEVYETVKEERPAESSNLAQGVTVTADSQFKAAALAVDGSVPGADSGREGWVSEHGAKDAPHWLMLDLGSGKTVSSIVVYHDTAVRTGQAEKAALYDTYAYEVQYWTGAGAPAGSEAADDADWAVIRAYTENEEAINTVELEQALENVRYVRLYIRQCAREDDVYPGWGNVNRARIQQVLIYGPDGADAEPGGNEPPAGYCQKQNIWQAQVEAALPVADGAAIRTVSWTADSENFLITRLSSAAGKAQEVQLTLFTADGREAGLAEDVIYTSRTRSAQVTVASKLVGAEAEALQSNGSNRAALKFTIPAEGDVYVVTAVGGGRYSGGVTAEDVIALLDRVTSEADIEQLREEHLRWWKEYWEQALVRFDNETLMRYYYGALYLMGSGCRSNGVAMGLAGTWRVNDSYVWSNNYTMNYNFVAPWFGSFSSNRLGASEPLFTALGRLIEPGKAYAAHNEGTHTFHGILIPTFVKNFDELYFDRGQKGNSGLCAMMYIMYYKSTYDDAFLLEQAWPFLREVEYFWDDAQNLQYSAEKGWEVLNSSPREDEGNHMVGDAQWRNSANDVAYLTQLYSFLSDDHVSDVLLQNGAVLGSGEPVTAAVVAEWKEKAEHMTAAPTVVVDGKTLLAECEGGKLVNGAVSPSMEGKRDNPDNLMSVFPANVIGIGSDPALVQCAKDTVEWMDSWYQMNAFPKIFTMAARVGYDADVIYSRLVSRLEGASGETLRNNLTINPYWHAVESIGALEAVNSMLLQSQENVLRLFPAWPAGEDAAFTDLRAYGAFLVSAAYDAEAQCVTQATVTSEKGREAVIQCPWESGMCVYDSRGQLVQTVRSVEENTGYTLYSFETAAGERYTLVQADAAAEELAAAKRDAIAAIRGYKQTLGTLREAEEAQIDAHIERAVAAIEQAETVEAVREIVRRAKADMDAVVGKKTDGAGSSGRGPLPVRKTDSAAGDELPFADVRRGDWFYDSVRYVYENGVMNGTGGGRFSPHGQTTRGMIVTLLHRRSGAAGGSAVRGSWWSEARAWAMEAGISDGTRMEDSITREQLAAMFYRYARLLGAEGSAGGTLDAFSDKAAVSDWAVEAVQWAVGKGILHGRADGTLDPKGLATRAEAAAMLMRFDKLCG